MRRVAATIGRVIPRTKLPAAIRALANRQSGVVSVPQLLDHGVSRRVISRLVADQTLSRVVRGVYAFSPPTWAQQVWVGVLLGGSNCVIGGLAAARIHGLTDEEPPVIDCYVGKRSHSIHEGPWHFIRAERLGRGEPPVTRIGQTIVDASRHVDADGIAAMIAAAGNRLRSKELLAALDAQERHPKRALLRETVSFVGQGALSALEVRYVRYVERPHRLPVATRQGNPTGHAKIDNLYEAYGVIVEVDGRRYHAGLAATKDALRDNEHLLAGLVTLRYSWAQISETPCAVAKQVAAALRLGGWTGEFQPCPRCRTK